MKKYVITAALVCLPAAVLAWQSGMATINLTTEHLQSAIERAARQKAEDGPASILRLGASEIAAARALPEAQQVALMRELAGAAKAIVMSPAFLAAHDAYIAKEHNAVNHGLKVKSGDQMLAGIGTDAGNAEFEKKMKRDMAAMYINLAMTTRIENLREMLDGMIQDWTQDSKSTSRDKASRAKMAALAARGQALKAVSEETTFRRGFAVLQSSQGGGPETEEELFGGGATADKEKAQAAWDQYNLRGGLKRALSQIVAEAPTVDFAAKTTMQSKTLVFVNPAYEKKSPVWKAMYRAGKAPTAAGVEFAKAWLKEL